MTPRMSRALVWLSAGIGLGLLAIAGFVRSGLYNVAADAPHTRPVHALLDAVRTHSIARHAEGIEVPDLDDPAKVVQGAGNYEAMCASCHASPGSGETELSRGLYPAPPDLTQVTVPPAQAFWVIKHGIKASGMPAWGKSMEDEYIWAMVALLQVLPTLDSAHYRALVERSDGHSHGAGAKPHAHPPAGDAEPDPGSAGHAHPPGTPPHHDVPDAGADPGTSTPAHPSHHDATGG